MEETLECNCNCVLYISLICNALTFVFTCAYYAKSHIPTVAYFAPKGRWLNRNYNIGVSQQNVGKHNAYANAI